MYDKKEKLLILIILLNLLIFIYMYYRIDSIVVSNKTKLSDIKEISSYNNEKIELIENSINKKLNTSICDFISINSLSLDQKNEKECILKIKIEVPENKKFKKYTLLLYLNDNKINEVDFQNSNGVNFETKISVLYNLNYSYFIIANGNDYIETSEKYNVIIAKQ